MTEKLPQNEEKFPLLMKKGHPFDFDSPFLVEKVGEGCP